MDILRTTLLAATMVAAGIGSSAPPTLLAQQPKMAKPAMTTQEKSRRGQLGARGDFRQSDGARLAGHGGAQTHSAPQRYKRVDVSAGYWAHHPPHIMILVPDPKALDGVSTDPHNGGPYVMFKGTPYVHIMAPIAGAMMMSMDHK